MILTFILYLFYFYFIFILFYLSYFREHQRDIKIASVLQDSMRFHLGGDSVSPTFQQTEQLSEGKTNSRKTSRELGLSDSTENIINACVNPDENNITDSNTEKTQPTGGATPNAEKNNFSGPGGVWGPNGYSRPETQNLIPKASQEYGGDSSKLSLGMGMGMGMGVGKSNMQRRNRAANAMFPQADIALSYYTSDPPPFHTKENFQIGVNRHSPGVYGERSVSFSPDRVQTRSDMPSILRSILKQENIDYQNDFYWMNRFQQDKMRDPEHFEKSMSQSTSILRKNNNTYASSYQGDSIIFDQDGSRFNSPGLTRNSRIYPNENPYYNRLPTRNPDHRLAGDRGGGDQSGFCFSLPEGLGGMGNSLGPGFESSILGGNMMRRESVGEGEGEGESDGGYSQSQLGISFDGRGALSDMRGMDSIGNQYAGLSQPPQRRVSQNHDKSDNSPPEM
jgi:hypothetical protein